MLERFIRSHQQEEQISRELYARYQEALPEYVQKTIKTFESLLGFLKGPETFPNQEVNKLAQLAWSLIGNREIPATLDIEGKVSTTTFIVAGNNREQTPLLILPKRFIIQASENPIFQLGMMAFMESQMRDFYTGKIREGSETMNRRSRAWEAEVLLTLRQMASNEGLNLNFNAYQSAVLSENPKGIRSLPPHLNYPTPVYRPPRIG